jgi:hypothetical protein
MSQEIESVRPALTVILDDGDFIINSTGPIGKAMAQAILPACAAARKVTIISDGEMKVMKRNGNGAAVEGARGQAATVQQGPAAVNSVAQRAAPHSPAGSLSGSEPDVQDQFAADLESGRTGEQATGEVPSPTPGPSDPVKIPAKRKPQIFQDAAAPPAPELAEAEMDRLLAEAAQAELDAAKVAEEQRFQRQRAVQEGAEPEETAQADAPRRRQRNLNVTGSPCGRCGGSGTAYRVDGDGGAVTDGSGHPITGVCNVCQGSGQVKRWGRGK